MLVYVYTTKDRPAIERTEEMTDTISVDFDEDGNVIGIEFTDAHRVTSEDPDA